MSSKQIISCEKDKGHTYIQWIVAILANTTLLTYGLQSGWMSPMTKVFQSEGSPTGAPLSNTMITWLSSIMCIVAVMTTSVYAYIADNYGRKVGVLCIIVPQLLCWAIKLVTANTIGILIARILAGVGSGGCFTIIPMYVKEISQDNIRGTLGSLLFLFHNLGFLFVYVLGSYLDYNSVIWIAIGLPVLSLILMLKAPESPAYLVKTGQVDEATRQLAFLRGLHMNDVTVRDEIETLKNEDLHFKALPNITLLVILKNKLYRNILFLILAMLTIQACNGNTAILTYASSIMASSGVTVSPELQALSIPAVMIIGSFLSMGLVDKISGRKVLLCITLLIASISLAALGAVLHLQHYGIRCPPWLPTTCIVLCAFVCGAGVLPVPYIIITEMLNFQIRAKIMGIIVTYAWFISFLQLICFGTISEALGMYITFYGFAMINFAGILIVSILIPETKGKRVEEIEKELFS